jgi:hypothetical protein
MTGKPSRVTLWPSAAQILGALLDGYETVGHPCFEEDNCEYAGDCNYEKSSRCKFAKQFQEVKMRLHRASYPENGGNNYD